MGSSKYTLLRFNQAQQKEGPASSSLNILGAQPFLHKVHNWQSKCVLPLTLGVSRKRVLLSEQVGFPIISEPIVLANKISPQKIPTHQDTSLNIQAWTWKWRSMLTITNVCAWSTT